jgi:hypothetical protein
MVPHSRPSKWQSSISTLVMIAKKQANLKAGRYCSGGVLILEYERGSEKLAHIHNHKPNARGCKWATLFLREINTGTWPSRFGESKK